MDERRVRERLRQVIDEIIEERDYQLKRWGQDHDSRHTPEEWSLVLMMWLGKALAETPFFASSGFNKKVFRKRLTQIAAICAAALEVLDSEP